MEIDRLAYAKAILELVAKPYPPNKKEDFDIKKNDTPKFMHSITQNILGNVMFIEPDDYLSTIISETLYSNDPSLR